MPASFTFDLGGVYATATFTLPLDEVDPGEPTQALDLDDLTVMIDGQVADADDFSGTPVANYAFGIFQGIGVTIVDSIPSPYTSIGIANNTVTGYSGSPPYTATVLYDPTDTQATFTLANGVSGALSYDIPWDDVDPDEASQSLPLSNFALSIAGYVLTPSTANFTTSPTAQFQYGDLIGITFAINTSTIFGFPYSSVSASGTTLTAIEAGTSTEFTTTLNDLQSAVSIDFKNVGNGFTYQLKITVKLEDGTSNDITITVEAGTTPGGTRDIVWSALKDLKINNANLDVTMSGETRLVVKGTTKSNFSELKFQVSNDPTTGAAPGIADVFTAGRQKTATVTPHLYYNNTEK